MNPVASARRFAERQMNRWRERHNGPPAAAANDPVRFQCNLCGTRNVAGLEAFGREDPSCSQCGSTVRFRAIAHLVTLETLGAPASLFDLAPRKDVTGLGLSDAEAYAQPLAAKFDYVNTFYHMEPRVDIANVDPAHFGRYDFVIASDVFEHVVPPVERAFANARRMLKPGGKFIFSVPFSLEPDTLEHFPELCDWSVAERDGQWFLTNTTADGRHQEFGDLVFHGGPGSTLEMRLFSRASLERAFVDAGFARMRVAAEPYLPFGIHWPVPWSLPMVAYA